MISEKTISAVFDAARIEDVVQDYLNLKRRGANLIGLCPFHNEKTPSFMVSPSKNIFKCFGCGRGGGSVHFLMEHEKFTYPEAVRHLAGKYKIPIEETDLSDEARQEMHERESLHLVNQFAQEYFTDNLWNTKEGKSIALTYLKERGFLESTIRKFGLGYAPAALDGLKTRALDAGISEERMNTLGLLTRNGQDFFRNRITFPIHNLSGKVIGFGARTLKAGPKEPKYLNSPESPVYNKRKVLYGLDLAKHAVRKSDWCVLVEGYTDVISMFQNGIENVVASSGTALTQDQVRSIKRFTENITVLYDGDEAGINAALRGLDIMLEEDVNVKLALIPDGKDPDTLVSEIGSQAFREFLQDEAQDFILFKTHLLGKKGSDDPIRKARAVKDIVQSVALIPDAIKRSMYIQQCAVNLHMDESVLLKEVNKARSEQLRVRNRQRERAVANEDYTQLHALQDKDVSTAPSTPRHSDEAREESIVRILLQFGHLYPEDLEGMSMTQYILSHIREMLHTFHNPVYARIVEEYIKGHESGILPSQERFMHHEDPRVASTVLEIIVPKFEYSENWEKKLNLPLLTQKMPDENFLNDCEDSILRFKQTKIHLLIQENQEMIRKYQDEGNAEKVALHLKMHAQYLQIKAAIEKGLNTIGIRL